MKTDNIPGAVIKFSILILISLFAIETEKLYSQEDYKHFRSSISLGLYAPTHWGNEEVPQGFGIKFTFENYFKKRWGIDYSLGAYKVSGITAYSYLNGQYVGINEKIETYFEQFQFNFSFFNRKQSLFIKVGPGYSFMLNDFGPSGGGISGQAAIEYRPVRWLGFELGYSSSAFKTSKKFELIKLNKTTGNNNFPIGGFLLSFNIGF